MSCFYRLCVYVAKSLCECVSKTILHQFSLVYEIMYIQQLVISISVFYGVSLAWNIIRGTPQVVLQRSSTLSSCCFLTHAIIHLKTLQEWGRERRTQRLSCCFLLFTRFCTKKLSRLGYGAAGPSYPRPSITNWFPARPLPPPRASMLPPALERS